jgi:hypothetical protein
MGRTGANVSLSTRIGWTRMSPATKVGWVIVAIIVLSILIFLWNLPASGEAHIQTGIALFHVAASR